MTSNDSSIQEKKKWLIERVRTIIADRIQRVDNERALIKSKTELVEADSTKWSKRFVAGASFLAPLILGLYAVDSSLKNIMLLALAADLGFGLASYIHYTSTVKRIQDLKLSTENAFLLAIEKLQYFRQYFDMDTYDVDEILKEKIDEFFNFHDFTSAAAEVGLIDNFQKMIDSKYFNDDKVMKSDLQERLRDKKELMTYGLEENYKTNISKWFTVGIRLDLLGFVYEDFFKYHGFTVDKKTGKLTKITAVSSEEKKKDTN